MAQFNKHYHLVLEEATEPARTMAKRNTACVAQMFTHLIPTVVRPGSASARAQHQMIQHLDAQQFPRLIELARNNDVLQRSVESGSVEPGPVLQQLLAAVGFQLYHLTVSRHADRMRRPPRLSNESENQPGKEYDHHRMRNMQAGRTHG